MARVTKLRKGEKGEISANVQKRCSKLFSCSDSRTNLSMLKCFNENFSNLTNVNNKSLYRKQFDC